MPSIADFIFGRGPLKKAAGQETHKPTTTTPAYTQQQTQQSLERNAQQHRDAEKAAKSKGVGTTLKSAAKGIVQGKVDDLKKRTQDTTASKLGRQLMQPKPY